MGHNDDSELRDTFLGVMLLVGAIIGGLIWLVGNVFTCPGVLTERGRVPLLALQDYNGPRGSFVLASGSIEGALYYSYYAREQGAIRGQTVPAATVLLYDDEEETPYYAPLTCERPSTAGWWQAPRCERGIVGALHVPKDSIVSEYRLDLEGQ